MSKEDAIGVFDSGIGGLTVAGALTRALPKERVVYLGDTARLPYGTKSPDVVKRYAEGCARFLLTQDIKLLVVACNTATAHALEHLQQTLSVPVIGVITPGAKRVSRYKRIGVIGTEGTIRSGAYERAIKAFAPAADVVQQACPLFVPLAEEGWTQHPATRLVAEHYLDKMKNVDALVLGCTHYPLLREVIAETVGEQVVLCDSADAVSEDVRTLLKEKQLEATAAGAHRFFMTDLQSQFPVLAQRFFGAAITNAERVDL
jgi:glutamate racemase